MRENTIIYISKEHIDGCAFPILVAINESLGVDCDFNFDTTKIVLESGEIYNMSEKLIRWRSKYFGKQKHAVLLLYHSENKDSGIADLAVFE